MATIVDIPGAPQLVVQLITQERQTHEQVSAKLQKRFPLVNRGLSRRSVRRFCEQLGIHSTSRLGDSEVDTVIRGFVRKVNHYENIGQEVRFCLLARVTRKERRTCN